MKKFLRKCFLFVFGLILFSCEGNEIISSLSTTSSKNTDFNYIVSNEEIIITGYKGHDKKVIIPSIIEVEGTTYSVTSIGDSAFYNYSSLTSIVIPNSVTSIGSSAFSGCSSLESITLPFVGASVTATGSSALFGYIFGTSSYTGGTATKQYYDSGSHLYGTYYIPSSLKEVVITGGTTISYGAFTNCSSLTSITIPNSVISIGEWAFYKCSSLTIYCEASSKPSGWDSDWNSSYRPVYWGINENNFIEKDGVQYVIINGEAIVTRYVGNDSEVVIPSSIEINGTTYNVTSIGNDAFYSCSSLTSITIPNSVTSIGYGAFENCSSLKYNEYDNAYYLGNNENPYLVLVKAKDTSITSCVINENTRIIIDYAFCDCSSLTSITIPNNVTSIGEYAFYNCSSLTSIVIPNNVTSIGNGAFSYCSSLTSIVIPNSVTSIGKYAFYGCNSLTSIEIPNSVTSIGSFAFYNCSSLTSIEIPNSVTSIEKYAFEYCSSLTIYCEASSKPSGWDSDWNSSYRPVYWGYKSN